MRPLWILLGVPSLLSACATSHAAGRDPWTADPPSERLVDHIEDLLAENPCVGNVKRWSRLYEWGLTKDGLDTNVVEIDLRQVGVFGFTPGRLIRSRDPSLKPEEIMVHADDRDYRFASGSYDVETGKLELRFCGRNRN